MPFSCTFFHSPPEHLLLIAISLFSLSLFVAHLFSKNIRVIYFFVVNICFISYIIPRGKGSTFWLEDKLPLDKCQTDKCQEDKCQGGQVPGGQVPGGQVPAGQVPGRTSYPRTSAMEDKFPQLFDSIKKGLALVLLVLVLLILQLSLLLYMTQPCARRAHRHPPSEQHPTIVGRIYPIQTHI